MRGLALLLLWNHGGGEGWLRPDKLQHFAMSFFVQSVSYSLARTTTGHSGALVLASGATAVVGLGKEWRDRGTTDFSAKDLVWDGAGALAASVLLSQTDRR